MRWSVIMWNGECEDTKKILSASRTWHQQKFIPTNNTVSMKSLHICYTCISNTICKQYNTYASNTIDRQNITSAIEYINNAIGYISNIIHQQYNTSAIHYISNTLHYRLPIQYPTNIIHRQYITPPIQYTTNIIHRQYNTPPIQQQTKIE